MVQEASSNKVMHYARYDIPGGFTVMHAIACRPNLFNCPYTRVDDDNNSELVGGSYYALSEVNGKIVVQAKLDELPKTELEQLRELHSRYKELAPYSESATIFYNALETALGILEGRKPEYKNMPDSPKSDLSLGGLND